MASRAPRRRRTMATTADGQATVELALALPLVAVFLLAMVQVVLIVRDQVTVIHAAREGARAAAVSASPSSAAGAAGQAASGLHPVSIRTSSAGKTVTVSVSYTDRTNVPLIGLFVPDVTVTGRVTMQFEP